MNDNMRLDSYSPDRGPLTLSDETRQLMLLAAELEKDIAEARLVGEGMYVPIEFMDKLAKLLQGLAQLACSRHCSPH